MSAQVAADLRAAAEVLRRDGWTQGWFYDTGCGGRCASGAVAASIQPTADRPGDLRSDGWRRWCDADDFLRGLLDDSVTDWNDSPDRTADEVIAALLAAADAAEAQS